MQSLSAQLEDGLAEFETLERELNTSYNTPAPIYAANTRGLNSKVNRDVKNGVRKALAASLGFNTPVTNSAPFRADTRGLEARLSNLGSRDAKSDVRNALQKAFGGIGSAEPSNVRSLDDRLKNLGSRDVKTDVRAALQNAFGGADSAEDSSNRRRSSSAGRKNRGRSKSPFRSLDDRLASLGSRDVKTDVRAALQNAFGGADSSEDTRNRRSSSNDRGIRRSSFGGARDLNIASGSDLYTSIGTQESTSRFQSNRRYGSGNVNKAVRNAIGSTFGEPPSPLRRKKLLSKIDDESKPGRKSSFDGKVRNAHSKSPLRRKKAFGSNLPNRSNAPFSGGGLEPKFGNYDVSPDIRNTFRKQDNPSRLLRAKYITDTQSFGTSSPFQANVSGLDAKLVAMGSKDIKSDVRNALQNAFGFESGDSISKENTRSNEFQPFRKRSQDFEPLRKRSQDFLNDTPVNSAPSTSYKADTSGLQARLDALGARDAKSDVRNALQNAFGGAEIPEQPDSRRAFQERGYKVSGAYRSRPQQSFQNNEPRVQASASLQDKVARYTSGSGNRPRSASFGRSSNVIRGRSPHRESVRRARAAQARSQFSRARSEDRSRFVYNRRASAYSDRSNPAEDLRHTQRSRSTPKNMKSPGKKSVTFDESPEVLLHGMPSGPPGRSRPARVYSSRNRSTTPDKMNKRINLDTIQKVKKSLQMLGKRGGASSFSPYGHNKFYKNLSTVPVPARAGQRKAQKLVLFKWGLKPRDCKTLSRDGAIQSVPVIMGQQRFRILVEYDGRNYNPSIRVALILESQGSHGIQSVNIRTLNSSSEPLIKDFNVNMREAYQNELELYVVRPNHPSFRVLQEEFVSGEVMFELRLSVDKSDFQGGGLGAPAARTSAPLMLQTGRLSDYTLTFHTRKWEVHRCILSTQSGVFKRLFDSQPEETFRGTHEIEIAKNDVEAEAFVEFLYNETLPENVSPKTLIELANHYEVRTLQEVVMLNQTDQEKREVALELLSKLRNVDSDAAKDVSNRLLALLKE